jgi:hypothetical protein
MRNYVFISNKNAFEIIDEHLNQQTTSAVEVSQNAKGKVLHFHNSETASRLALFVEDQRNMIAFDIMVLPLSQDEKRSARDTVRSLTRIADELTLVGKQLKEKEVTK